MDRKSEVRCAALYRVSTARQANRRDADEEPIPMQRDAVRKFIAARPGWKLVLEFAEEGVSAYQNSSEDRDILQEIIERARDGEFDVLLVFKADRLSRQAFEYPLILSMLHRAGVKVYSVADEAGGKELKVDGQYDKLLRFLEGWQAETESYNTSIRVSTRMRQLAEKGRWTGGRAPFGYRSSHSPDLPVPLVVDPKEAEVIRRAFDLYLDEGLGTTTIASQLNAEGYTQRNGNPWSDGRLRRVMQNPILSGRLSYGRTYKDARKGYRVRRGSHELDGVVLSEPYEHLVIIPVERWQAAMEKMQAYNRRSRESRVANGTWHNYTKAGSLLFTGIARCGHCGGPMVSAVVKSYRHLRDGSTKRYAHDAYVCQVKATRGTHLCDGQRTYSAKKAEAALLATIRETLSNLDMEAIVETARSQAEQMLWSHNTRRDLLARQLQEAERIMRSWVQRLEEHFAHPERSLYSEELLAQRVRESEERVRQLREDLKALEAVRLDHEAQRRSLDAFLRFAGDWWKEFLAASRKRQRLLVQQVVEKVVFRRDGYDIHYRVSLEALTGRGRQDLRWRESGSWKAGARA
jgi:site-specific DNA recombinase